VAGTGHHWWADGLIIAPLIAASMLIDTYGRRALRPLIDRFQSSADSALT